MPRSIHDIVDHADQLAERFELLEPDQLAEIPVEEYLLQRAVIARARSEQQLLGAVATARANGLPWHTIGAIIGTSAQAAHQRYGALVDSHDTTRNG